MGEKTLQRSRNPISEQIGNQNHSDVSDVADREDATRSMEADIALNAVRKKLEAFQSTILEDVQKKMDIMVDDIVQEIRQYEVKTTEFKNLDRLQQKEIWSNRKLTKEASETNGIGVKRKLPDKVFVPRESYLTCLLEVDHIKAIYHIFFAILLILMLNSVLSDYFLEGRINLGFGTFKGGLKGIHQVLGVWSVMHIAVFGLYYALKVWAKVRYLLREDEKLQSIWSYSCLVMFVCFQLTFGYIGSMTCIKFDLPFVTSSVMLLETIRLIMKMHAFVRTNASKQVAGKLKTDDDEDGTVGVVPFDPFSAYVYYLFAPTFIYRNSYPRTKKIRWSFALARLMEVVGVAFVYSYIYERYMHPNFEGYGKEQLTSAGLTVKIFGMLMPGIIIFLCGFYMILHSWLNFTSELLRFADRMFYKDWWTASNYETYFRNWNVVVHDWLYEYVYKDMYTYVFKGSKFASSLTVFFVSAYVHEHILAFGFKFFYPVMFFMFLFVGVALVFATRNLPKGLGNMILWFTIAVGNGIIISLYLMEHFARRNCPVTDSVWYYFVPVSLSCNGIVSP